MLNKIEAVSETGAVLSLSLGDISEGYSVQEITGLDPVPANIVSSSFARLDGDQFQSARREKRNQVIRLGLEPDYVTQTASELRHRLYSWFMPKRNVVLRYFTDEVSVLEIEGVVESFDCPLFVREPTATISVLNFDPDFYEPELIEYPAMTTPIGENQTIVYEGSVDTGFEFEISFNRNVYEFEIFIETVGGFVQSMPITGSFTSGDRVYISTVPGNKYVRRLRGGVLSSILYALSPFANWGVLQPGENSFRVNMTGDALPYTVRYKNKHGGL